MKWLIWEYITGGGLIGQPLPSGLVKEALLMVRALLRDLAELPESEPVLLLDSRLAAETRDLTHQTQVHWLTCAGDLARHLAEYADQGAGIWPIAPESEAILPSWLTTLNRQFQQIAALTPTQAALFADKWATYRWCLTHDLPTPLTWRCQPDSQPDFPPPWVLKPRFGAGCEETYRLTETCLLPKASAGEFLLQPYLSGESLSLSVLFRQGQGEIMAVNRQNIVVRDGRFQLMGCEVNSRPIIAPYRQWLSKIGRALPDLQGYLGIDFILSDTGSTWIVDINPRLTTAYAGLREALGLNIAACWLTGQAMAPVTDKTVSLNWHD